MLKHTLALSLAVTLASCGLFETRAEQQMRNTPSYREGYDDGCASASTPSANPREGQVRDDALYQSDAAYRAGWSNGFSMCRSNSAPQQSQSGPIPDTEPGR
jgi:hypothetical protein